MPTRPNSTRLAIVHTALADIIERLGEMPLTPEVRELRIKAATFSRIVRGWNEHPPSEDQRGEMMKSVIDLNVKVINLGKTPA